MIELPSEPDVARLVAAACAASPDFAARLERCAGAAPALRHLGIQHWQGGAFDLAAMALRSALALTPTDAALWRDLAGVYAGAADPARARACLLRALELDPASPHGWLLLAGIENRCGDKRDAEAAYRRAIDLDPALAEAHLGLGLLCVEQQRFEEAVERLRAAAVHAPDDRLVRACLGHALYGAGEFASAASAFAAAAALGPLDAAERRTFAYARTLQTMIEGNPQAALEDYAALAGEGADDVATVARTAFLLLNGFGHRAAAAELGRLRLAADPDDPVQRHLLHAVTGEALDRAPADYVERYFDEFAPTFDGKLTGALGYRVPEQLARLVAAHRSAFDAVLDLGCGTGLAADHLAGFGGRLTGVDLSANMLEGARRRGRYADLLKVDAVTFLGSAPSRFDLVFAADLLVYLGDLAPLFSAAASGLKPGGLFALSIETQAAGGFALLPSGRFAHAPAYIEALAAGAFILVETVASVLRLEGRRPIDGRLVLLRRGELPHTIS